MRIVRRRQWLNSWQYGLKVGSLRGCFCLSYFGCFVRLRCCVLYWLNEAKWTLSDRVMMMHLQPLLRREYFFFLLYFVYCLPLYFLRKKGSIGKRCCVLLLLVLMNVLCAMQAVFFRFLFLFLFWFKIENVIKLLGLSFSQQTHMHAHISV